ncbi:inactive protein RESTRICTED TEV MOVEMENT 2 [Syzygium oleosum]|uniref:inactive protein RESTRICTED TEV MOVEMENT 2 n=1 Tax=Syzygium oleosum TaxID=219896 RepID=UPI0024BBCD95|nr:inactive protein RESTRICTED TEV MOVEMENT 2 [Syzygium oleosum]
MDARTAGREYEDFDPTTNWALEDTSDTLLIHLPGFKKEQLRVQISTAGNLRVMGERLVSGNKWSRFRKELPISSNYDSNKIGAKFDNGILHVKFPKIIVPAEPRKEAKPAVQPTKPPEPTPTAEPPKTGQKQDTKEPPKAEKAPEKAPAKPTEEEKKPKKSTEDEEKPKEVKEESKKADEAKIRPEQALQQKKREDLAEKKATEKDQKRGDTADIGKKMENAGGSIAKLKKPRYLLNTLVAALLIVVLGLYVKYALRSLGTTKSDPEL